MQHELEHEPVFSSVTVVVVGARCKLLPTVLEFTGISGIDAVVIVELRVSSKTYQEQSRLIAASQRARQVKMEAPTKT